MTTFKFKIPEKIILLNEEFKIEIGESKEYLGHLSLDKKVILINKDLSESEQILAFLHEVYHYFGVYHMDDQSEILAHSLSKFTHHILKNLFQEVEDDKPKRS